jgi:uncharacterized phage-associated protein
MASVDAVADYILGKIVMDEGDSITNLKLQKIVYYCQAWNMALHDAPLFDDPIEAWVHGPAVPALYRRFKKYGFNAVDVSAVVTDPMNELADRDRSLIDEVWDVYGVFSGSQLRNMTHKERPWLEARASCREDEPCSNPIDLIVMRDYYRQRLDQSTE